MSIWDIIRLWFEKIRWPVHWHQLLLCPVDHLLSVAHEVWPWASFRPHWASLVPGRHCPSPIFHHLLTLLSFLHSQTLSPEQTCWSANSRLTPTSFSNVPFSSWPVNETQMSSKDTAVNVAASSWCPLISSPGSGVEISLPPKHYLRANHL